MNKLTVLLAAALFAVGFSWNAQSANYYVSASGSDSNSGTQALPFLTIAHADSVTVAGDTVHVLAGTYPGNITTSHSGTSSAHIKFISDTKWAAKINYSSSDILWWSAGDYVDLVGFEVDGSNNSTLARVGLYPTGSYASAKNNHVHHLFTGGSCGGGGAGGIVVDSYYSGTHTVVDSNLVHDVGPAGCVFDHGVYLSQPYATASNNVVYNISGYGVHGWHDDNHLTIVNNTLTNNGGGVLVGGGDYYVTTGPSDFNVVANNIVANNDTGMNWSGDHGTHDIYTNNLFFGNTNNVTGTGLTFAMLLNTVTTDPKLVSSSDWHLQSTSPAISAATSTYTPSADYDGNTRPQGTGYDIGAYEYVSGVPLVITIAGPASITGLPASAGAGGVYICIDSAGLLYRKSSCP